MENIKKNLSAKPRRDEAAEMFRRYARLGIDKSLLSTFEVYGRIRGVSRSEEEALKLLGVYDMMRLLTLTDEESARAVRAVYFAERGRRPAKNQTSERILRFASENHLDERTVYRRLRSAKELYHHLISQ
jgi:hypothetical protein